MIKVTDNIFLHEAELKYDFVRSSGPGGQNVNKVATAVKLRFDAAQSPNLPNDVRQRLITLAGKHINSQGTIIIDARNHRTQERNRVEALNRLTAMITQAEVKPKKRRPTKPSFASKKRRLEAKKKRSTTKALRKRPSTSD